MTARVSKKARGKKAAARAVRSGTARKTPTFKRVSRRQIQAVVDRLVAALDPEKVILFGSYAYGKPTIDSDVDMLIILETEEDSTCRTVRALRAIKGVKTFPMYILVRTPKEIARRLVLGDFFFKEVLERGRVVYERRFA